MPYLKKERVNKYGLTGCLNIYNSNLNKTSIKTINGDCEDSVNISNSKGSVSNIEVINASQDGIDIDYSNLNISNIFVRNAGNDCFDVSAGSYNINAGTFSECNDKGISIGEKSYLTMQNIFINSSNTAISVKDLSKAIIKKASFTNNKICIEAVQKKQEFGGLAFLKNSKCKAQILLIAIFLKIEK